MRVRALEHVRHVGARAALVAPRSTQLAPPTVTVVIPCYNYGRYLPAAVASVTTQSAVRPDVIVVDDASTDGSAQVAARLAADDPRVRLIAHERNRGHIQTYNDGLEAATGEYCVLMSADDMLAPGALERAVAVMQANPSVGMVYGAAVPFTVSPPAAVTDVRAWALWAGIDWVRLRCERATNTIRSPEVVVRTSVQHAAGGYRADLPHSGDMEMWIRLASIADVGRVIGPHQAYYRVHEANMHSQTFGVGTGEGILVDLQNRLLVFEAWQEWMDARAHPCNELVDSARRSLAREALVLAYRAYRWGHVDEWPVERLQQFAIDTYEGARNLAEWCELERHVRVGIRTARLHPRFVVLNRIDILQNRWKLRRQSWTGV